MMLGTLRPVEAVGLASIRPSINDAAAGSEVAAIRRNVVTLRPTSRGKIVGQHPSIRRVLDTIDRVAASMCTVLVRGESGTGKELVVAALHDASKRRSGPIVTINCGAIPADLVESELFGHSKGAFTGAQVARRGHVASAEGGTLFLDEVGELPMPAQVKLLRLLQQREYTPVGESRAVKCDVRIVAATNRDLRAEVAAGRFREDLYYRLNVIELVLPPLRERGSDLRLLAAHFYRTAVVSSGRSDLRGLSEAALSAIESHPWPGNVRALENAIERGVLLARGPLVEAEDVLGAGVTGVSDLGSYAIADSTAVTAPNLPYAQSSQSEQGAAPYVAPLPPKAPRTPASASVTIEDALGVLANNPRYDLPADLFVETREAKDARFPTVVPRAAVLPLPMPPMANPIAESVRHASNPAFPRVLPDHGVDLFAAVESYQNHLIRQALARTGGNKNRAAQLLGLNRTTLVEMIRRRGL